MDKVKNLNQKLDRYVGIKEENRKIDRINNIY